MGKERRDKVRADMSLSFTAQTCPTDYFSWVCVCVCFFSVVKEHLCVCLCLWCSNHGFLCVHAHCVVNVHLDHAGMRRQFTAVQFRTYALNISLQLLWRLLKLIIQSGADIVALWQRKWSILEKKRSATVSQRTCWSWTPHHWMDIRQRVCAGRPPSTPRLRHSSSLLSLLPCIKEGAAVKACCYETPPPSDIIESFQCEKVFFLLPVSEINFAQNKLHSFISMVWVVFLLSRLYRSFLFL